MKFDELMEVTKNMVDTIEVFEKQNQISKKKIFYIKSCVKLSSDVFSHTKLT